MNLRTPGVRQRHPSFTQVLTTEIQRMLKEQQCVKITMLHREMLKKEHQLQQQPLHVAVCEDSHGSIVLSEFKGSDSRGSLRITQAENNSALVLRVSLFEPLNTAQKAQILRWMTSSTPSAVSAITVEQVFLMSKGARILGQKVVEERSQAGMGEMALDIPYTAKPAIMTTYARLKSLVDEPLLPRAAGGDHVSNVVEELRGACEEFLDVLRDCMSMFGTTSLHDLARVPEARIEGLAQRVSLRLRLLDTSSSNESSENGNVHFATPANDRERFRPGSQEGVNVLVEYQYYSEASSTIQDKALTSTIAQIRKIAALHAEPKDDIFCTLVGRGYTHEHLHGPRFGLIYEIPPQYASSPYFVLSDCYRSYPTVPLDTRVGLAYRVSLAVCSMHSIGWLHKALKSQHILLFGEEKTRDDGGSRQSQVTNFVPDFDFPYIFGFECSRPEAEESLLQNEWDQQSNLYRHPDRWGRPLKYQKAHDIYALVKPRPRIHEYLAYN